MAAVKLSIAHHPKQETRFLFLLQSSKMLAAPQGYFYKNQKYFQLNAISVTPDNFYWIQTGLSA